MPFGSEVSGEREDGKRGKEMVFPRLGLGYGGTSENTLHLQGNRGEEEGWGWEGRTKGKRRGSEQDRLDEERSAHDDATQRVVAKR